MIKLNFWENRIYIAKCLACFGAFIIQGFIDNAKGILLPDVKLEKEIDYALYSFLPNAMLIGYVIFSLSSASIIYKYGYKWSFVLGYLGPIIGFIGIYFIDNLYAIMIFLFLASAGLGSLDLSGNSLGTITFKSHVGLMFCILVFFYGVGSFLAPPYIKLWYYLCPSFGYREQYLVALIPIVLFLIPTLFVPFNKDSDTNLEYQKLENEVEKGENTSENNGEKLVEKPQKSSPYVILKDVRLWTIILIQAFTTITERATSSWGVLYATSYLHVSKSTASDFFTYFLMIYTFSRLITGFITDRLRPTNSLYFLEIGTLICAGIGFSVSNTNVALGFIASTGFFVSTFWPAIMGIIMGHFKHDSETATGFILPFQCVIQIGVMYMLGVINDSFGDEYAYMLSYASTGIALVITVFIDILIRMEEKEEKKNVEESMVNQQLMA